MRATPYRPALPTVVANEHASPSATEKGELAKLREEVAALRGENKILRKAYEEILEQYKLLKHRLFVAKAERLNTSQLEIEFADLKAKLDALGAVVEASDSGASRGSDAPRTLWSASYLRVPHRVPLAQLCFRWGWAGDIVAYGSHRRHKPYRLGDEQHGLELAGCGNTMNDQRNCSSCGLDCAHRGIVNTQIAAS